MSIQKAVLHGKGVCRITFRLTDTLIDHPREVSLVGDFNNWDPRKDLMHKTQGGFFEDTIELPLGKDYQFRYLIDRHTWANDWQADAFVPNPFGAEENMVISCSDFDEPD